MLKIIENFGYQVSSNIIAIFISTLVVFIAPKIFGVEDYGYFQLYTFYSSYVTIFQLGWNDGIYLRLGGEKYESLDKNNLSSQFHLFSILQIIIGLIIFTMVRGYPMDSDRTFVLISVIAVMYALNTRSIIQMIYQATLNFKKNGKIIIYDRLIYLALLLILFTTKKITYKNMIVVDLIGRYLSLIYACFISKDIIFGNKFNFLLSLKESYLNISVGIKLLISNVSSNLIIGVVRFGIEKAWNIATFGKVSLTLSISNLLMIFVNAIGLIFFPVLRRANNERLAPIYLTLRELFSIIMLISLMLFFPLRTILVSWLPSYQEGLKFMGVLFPIVIFEGKMALIINPYLKALRKETKLLQINIYSVSVSVLVTIFTTSVFQNINFAVLSILILLLVRATVAEYYLCKIIKVQVLDFILLEYIAVFIFVYSTWYLSSLGSIILYGTSCIIIVYFRRNRIDHAIKNVKKAIMK